MDVAEQVRNKNAIDLLITLVVNELAEESHRKAADVLADFLLSETARRLYDETNKLWWDGPSAIAQMFRDEMSVKQLVTSKG